MSDRDTDTGTSDTLTPDAFSPAGAAPTSEQLAATAFEPLSQASEQRRRINITQIALGVAGVLVATLLFFLFTARSLTLNIDAEAEPDFSLSGLNWSFGERLLVRPGDYTLSITAEGYHPYEQTVTVGDADTQQLDIRLAPLPGTVTLTTQPAGGEIILDELSLGSAPLVDLSLEAVSTQWKPHSIVTSAGRDKLMSLAATRARPWTSCCYRIGRTFASAPRPLP